MYRTIQARLRSNKKSMRRKSWEWVFFLISLSAKLQAVATELVGLQPQNYGFLEETSPSPQKTLFALPLLSQRCQNEVGCKKYIRSVGGQTPVITQQICQNIPIPLHSRISSSSWEFRFGNNVLPTGRRCERTDSQFRALQCDEDTTPFYFEAMVVGGGLGHFYWSSLRSRPRHSRTLLLRIYCKLRREAEEGGKKEELHFVRSSVVLR